MGAAYYPVLHPAIPGFQPELVVSGKATARAMPVLDEISAQLGVRALSDYYSESVEEAFAKIGEPVPPGMKDEPIKWSYPADGLETVRALANHLRSNGSHDLEITDSTGRTRTVSAEAIASDLEALASVLTKAVEQKCSFRLRTDI